jgi:hypothetical protein
LRSVMTTGERPSSSADRNHRRSDHCVQGPERALRTVPELPAVRLAPRQLKLSTPENDLVFEQSARRLLPGIDAIPDRAALHEDDRVWPSFRVTVADSPSTYLAFAARAIASKPRAER